MSTNVSLQAGKTWVAGESITTAKLNASQVASQTLVNDIDNFTKLGSGEGLVFQKSGNNLEFKSLKVAGAVSIASTNNDITITLPTYPMINIYSKVLVVNQSTLSVYAGNWTLDAADTEFTSKYTLTTGEVEIPSTGRYTISVSQRVANNYITDSEIGFSIGGTIYTLGSENVMMKTSDIDNLSTGEGHSLIRTLDFTAGDLIKPMGKCNATGATITVDLAEFSVRKVPA